MPEAALPESRGPRFRVLFLSGAAHSGTTMIERVLAQWPGVVSVGELRHLWLYSFGPRERCGCGESLPACRFWTGVLDRALGAGADRIERFREAQARADRMRHLAGLFGLRTPGYARDLRAYQQLLLRLYRAAAEVAGAELVIDTSKTPTSLRVLELMPELDVRHLHLVRDSRGVAHSFKKQREQRPDRPIRDLVLPPRAAALNWALSQTVAEACRRAPRLRLRYEDLVARPAAGLEAIAALAGLPPPAPGLLDGGWVRLRTESHGLFGNVMRFSQAGDLQLRLDEEWRHALSRAERWTVTGLTWPWLAWYGYLGARGPAAGPAAGAAGGTSE